MTEVDDMRRVLALMHRAVTIERKYPVPRRTVTSDTIRDELDQSPRWWDREYQRLVSQTFRPKPFNPTDHQGHNLIEVRSITGPTRTYCTDCPTVLEPIQGDDQ